MPNDNKNSARTNTTTRILKLFKQRKMAKNYGTHALPWPSHMRKNWQNQEFEGGEKAKFFQKTLRSGFLAIIRTLFQ